LSGEPDNEERWLLTYSDMITLLLALFVVLFSLSTINNAKFVEFATGVREALGPTSSPMPSGSSGLLQQTSLVSRLGEVPEPRTIAAPANPQSDLRQLEAEIRAALASRDLLQAVDISLGPNQLEVRLLADRTFFATNSAALSTTGAEVVDAVGGVLSTHRNAVVVSGYTDSTPVVGGPFFSNYMLSAARAVEVVERLVHHDDIAEPRLYATAYGSTHPAVPNTTAVNRARNRRVDILILGGG